MICTTLGVKVLVTNEIRENKKKPWYFWARHYTGTVLEYQNRNVKHFFRFINFWPSGGFISKWAKYKEQPSIQKTRGRYKFITYNKEYLYYNNTEYFYPMKCILKKITMQLEIGKQQDSVQKRMPTGPYY